MANFQEDETYLPVTMQQWENLTNEILTEFNKLADPHFLNGDYFSQILMSAIHAYDHKVGWVSKSELFDSCVNRISCHVTYSAVQAIQARIKAEGGIKPQLVESEDDSTNEPVIPAQ